MYVVLSTTAASKFWFWKDMRAVSHKTLKIDNVFVMKLSVMTRIDSNVIDSSHVKNT